MNGELFSFYDIIFICFCSVLSPDALFDDIFWEKKSNMKFLEGRVVDLTTAKFSNRWLIIILWTFSLERILQENNSFIALLVLRSVKSRRNRCWFGLKQNHTLVNLSNGGFIDYPQVMTLIQLMKQCRKIKQTNSRKMSDRLFGRNAPPKYFARQMNWTPFLV